MTALQWILNYYRQPAAPLTLMGEAKCSSLHKRPVLLTAVYNSSLSCSVHHLTRCAISRMPPTLESLRVLLTMADTRNQTMNKLANAQYKWWWSKRCEEISQSITAPQRKYGWRQAPRKSFKNPAERSQKNTSNGYSSSPYANDDVYDSYPQMISEFNFVNKFLF